MAQKKKTTDPAPEATAPAEDLEAQAQEPEDTQADAQEQTDPTPQEDTQATEPEAQGEPEATAPAEDLEDPDPDPDPEDLAPEDLEPEPLTADTPLPCIATVAVALAVLRKNIGPGTAQQLRPVATLEQGTHVTIRAVVGEDAQLANGLWTKAAFLTV